MINEIRAFLLERGIAVAQGYQRLRKALPDILATREDVLSLRMRHTIEELAEDWRYLDTRIERVSIAIQALAEDGGPCERLMTMPGVAHIISTATVAAIGDGRTFERGRDFAAWLGLVPRQISTGDRTILGKISKRGNPYLRTLYCQAARVVLVKSQLWERYGLKAWIESKRKRLHHNKLAIALANKLARIAWALLTKGRDYEVTRYDPTSPQPA